MIQSGRNESLFYSLVAALIFLRDSAKIITGHFERDMDFSLWSK
jgi:hypothetical protein